MILPAPTTTLFPYTTLFRSHTIRFQIGNSRSVLNEYKRRRTNPQFKQCAPLHGRPLYSGLNTSRFKIAVRSEEHTSELQSRRDLVCRLLLEKKKTASSISYF